MKLAGRAVAGLVLALSPPGTPILVLCGEGHNGGDGWVAARHLHAAGWPVRVWAVQRIRPTALDAAAARQGALDAGVVELQDAPWVLEQAPVTRLSTHGLVVVDALLGLGAREPLPSEVAAAIRWVDDAQRAVVPSGQATAVQVISVDLPSGLQPDTGRRLNDPMGHPCAIRADHTLSLLTLKPGLYTHEGRDYAGRVWFNNLAAEPAAAAHAECRGTEGPGVVPQRQSSMPHQPVETVAEPCAQLAAGPTLIRRLAQVRLQADGTARQGGHKGIHGDAWLIGGAPGMRGALMLAARAAMAAGAGRVHRVELGDDAHQGQDPCPSCGGHTGEPDPAALEVMTPSIGALRATLERASGDSLDRSAGSGLVLVVGCGGGVAVAELLPECLQRAPRLVLDADALNALARDRRLLEPLAKRAAQGHQTILTPHPLEAARLLGWTTAQVQADRWAAAQALAQQAVCTVVLKGAGSIVASPGRRPWVNSSGNARLASGGTGDVLAGWIGGAWAGAQRDFDPHDLAAACVQLHGLAADRLNPETGRCDTAVLTASALVGEMARELVCAAHGDQG